jgi:3D (Asp-Asp-Asp) domain-containing protein
LYGYADPIRYTDPSGNDPWWCGNDLSCYAKWIKDYQKNNCLPLETSPTETPPIETPTPIISELIGGWKITHYNYALENDPQFPAGDKIPIPGLDPSKVYRRQFIYSPAGIIKQGTGLSEEGEYITIDQWKNLQKYGSDWMDNTSIVNWYFTYGKGGAFAESVPWATVAITKNEPQLKGGDIVKIEGYNQTFTVTDTGSFTDTSHVDMFIGPTTYAEALAAGTQTNVRVWKVIGK